MQFVEHTHQQRVLGVIAQLLYGQLALRYLGQQVRRVLRYHSVFEHMKETSKAATEIGMYAQVPDYLAEQVPTQVFTLVRTCRQIELVGQITYHECRQLVVHLNEIAMQGAAVVVAAGELCHVVVLRVGTHVKHCLEPVARHQFHNGVLLSEEN